jgi:hypothetical protein
MTAETVGNLSQFVEIDQMPAMTMPPDFPSVAFDAFVERAGHLEDRYRKAHSDRVDPDWAALASATNGLTYRWLALADAEKTFGSAFTKLAKTNDDRYIEESALFAFFSNALSAIELRISQFTLLQPS